MATQTANLTADGDTLIATLNLKHPWENNQIGVHVMYQGVGTGTITFKYSLDGGTTKATVKSGAGTSAGDVTYTASGGFTWNTPITTGGDPILLYASVASASSLDVDVYVIDQNNG